MSEMLPRLTWQRNILHLRNPFRLAYGVSETRHTFWLRLADDAGWGEAAIPPYYGIDDASMIAMWEAAALRTEPFPDDLAQIEAWVGSSGPAPARCALDLALHDRIAQLRGVPLHALLDLPAPVPLPTSFTIAIADPDEMARLASEASGYPILKIKLGSDDDAARLAAVRAARPGAILRVDANAGWSAEEAVARIDELERYGLEMIEQPVAKHDIAGMGVVQAHTSLPVVADESVQSLADIEALAAAGVRGINLKLQKVGGLGPGVCVLQRARELGLRVLFGCMIETSLGTTAMAHLAGLADWLDLDAPLLISNDPFDGLTYGAQAGVHVPGRPGIGALVKPAVVGIILRRITMVLKDPKLQSEFRNPRFFDAHCDTVMRVFDGGLDFVAGQDRAHIDLPRLLAAGYCIQLFAIFAPKSEYPDRDLRAFADDIIAVIKGWVEASGDRMRLVTEASHIRDTVRERGCGRRASRHGGRRSAGWQGRESGTFPSGRLAQSDPGLERQRVLRHMHGLRRAADRRGREAHRVRRGAPRDDRHVTSLRRCIRPGASDHSTTIRCQPL